jgi:hypothetical protein
MTIKNFITRLINHCRNCEGGTLSIISTKQRKLFTCRESTEGTLVLLFVAEMFSVDEANVLNASFIGKTVPQVILSLSVFLY